MSRTNNSNMGIPSHEDILIELLEDGSDVGPHGRNLAIWDKIIDTLEEKYYYGEINNVGGTKPFRERHFRILRKAYIMMKNEFMKLNGETSALMAIIEWQILNMKMNRGEISTLVLFHDGKMN